MSNDIKTSIVVDLEGNLSRQARRNEKSIERFTRNSSKHLSRLNRNVKGISSSFASMGKKYLGVAAAGAVAMSTGKKLLGLEKRYERLGVQAGMSPKQAIDLRRRVYKVAQSSDIRIDPNELLSSIEAIVTKRGKTKITDENLRNMGMAISASGARGENIGSMIADANEKFGITDKESFTKLLDTYSAQGKAGAFTLQDMSTQGERVTSAYAGTNRKGLGAAREMGAVLQMVRRGFGSSEETSTAFSELIDAITNKKVAELQKRGITVWDPDELKKGNKIARAIPEIIKDIVKATDGDIEKIGKVFEGTSTKALKPFLNEYNSTGGFKSLNDFLSVKGDGKSLAEDSARIARTGSSRLTNINSMITDKTDAAAQHILSGSFFKSWQNIGFGSFINSDNSGDKSKSEAKVELEIKTDTPVTVKSIKSNNIDLTVDSGASMSGN